ncbi:MAG: hypothetical protein AB8F26_06115 [Phycisphaerales bacterium]
MDVSIIALTFAGLTCAHAISIAAAEEPARGGLTCAFAGHAAQFLPIPPTEDEFTEYAWVRAEGDTGFVAFFGNDSEGILAFDFSDPVHPALLGALEVENFNAFELHEQTMFVLSETDFGSQRLRMYNVSDPSGIFELIGSINGISGSVDGIDTLGDLVLTIEDDLVTALGERSDGSFDFIGAFGTIGGNFTDGASNGSTFYVLERNNSELIAIDFSAPSFPQEAFRVTLDGPILFGDRVDTAGERLVVAGRSWIEIFDIADPNAPVSGGRLFYADLLEGYALGGSSSNVSARVRNNEAFIALENAGVFRFDITNPSEPALTGHVATPGYPFDMDVSGNRVLVGDLYAGVAIIDTLAMNNINPVFDRTPLVPEPEQSRDSYVVIEGEIGYVALDRGGLYIFDLSDPDSPRQLAWYDIHSNNVYDIDAQNGFVYIAADEDGLEVVDATDPENPALAYRFNPLGGVESVSISGDHLAINTSQDAAVVLDISDPTQAAIEGLYGDLGVRDSRSFTLHDGVLYYLGRLSFLDQPVLRTIDIRDPFDPVYADFFTEHEFSWVQFDSGMIYLVVEGNDFGTVLTAPINDFSQFDSFDTGAEARTFLVDAGVGYFRDSVGKVRAFDGLPHAPALIGVVNDSEGRTDMLATREGVLYASPQGLLTSIDISRDCALCPPDLDTNGELNFFDISTFLTLFNTQADESDYDQNGQIDFFDIATFLADFATGCP